MVAKNGASGFCTALALYSVSMAAEGAGDRALTGTKKVPKGCAQPDRQETGGTQKGAIPI
jgi:hypothetical protein